MSKLNELLEKDLQDVLTDRARIIRERDLYYQQNLDLHRRLDQLGKQGWEECEKCLRLVKFQRGE